MRVGLPGSSGHSGVGPLTGGSRRLKTNSRQHHLAGPPGSPTSHLRDPLHRKRAPGARARGGVTPDSVTAATRHRCHAHNSGRTGKAPASTPAATRPEAAPADRGGRGVHTRHLQKSSAPHTLLQPTSENRHRASPSTSSLNALSEVTRQSACAPLLARSLATGKRSGNSGFEDRHPEVAASTHSTLHRPKLDPGKRGSGAGCGQRRRNGDQSRGLGNERPPDAGLFLGYRERGPVPEPPPHPGWRRPPGLRLGGAAGAAGFGPASGEPERRAGPPGQDALLPRPAVRPRGRGRHPGGGRPELGEEHGGVRGRGVLWHRPGPGRPHRPGGQRTGKCYFLQKTSKIGNFHICL
ncbi:translation initiation factor IF-2 [Ictidomys tridecemlineatus]|nr:translation initiation factor IF-2 [Ictidomys tridecemlineatus]